MRIPNQLIYQVVWNFLHIVATHGPAELGIRVFVLRHQCTESLTFSTLAGRKQVVPDDQAQDDDNNSKKSIGNKEHDRHADTKPEQNKAKKTFQYSSPSFPLQYFMRVTDKCFYLIFTGNWCKLILVV